MPVTLRNVPGVSGMKEFRPETAMRPKHLHADLASDDVLPFVSIRMPVQLPECAGFKVESNAGDRCRDWKARGIDAPFAAAFEHAMWRFRKHLKFMRLRRRNVRTLKIF